MDNCIFCKIRAKTIPARIVHEDEHLFAFEDINPQAPVHILLVPNRHIPTTLDIRDQDREIVGRLFQAAARIARERGIAEPGFRLVMNTNADAGQTVFHIHLHLLGGRAMGWPPG
ncbi:MAG: histidine triad nucleotide-binding protein [Thermodesulfovibrionales bacterium]